MEYAFTTQAVCIMPCWLGVQLMSDVHAGSIHRRENYAESGQNTDGTSS